MSYFKAKMHQIRSVLAAAALHNGAGGTSPSCEGCQCVPAMHQRIVLTLSFRDTVWKFYLLTSSRGDAALYDRYCSTR